MFAGFSPDLPPAYRQARMVFLGNIDPNLQLRVLDQVENAALVGELLPLLCEDGLPAAEPSGIYALRLASDPSSRTRLLLEFLKQRFGPIPPWDLALQRGLKRS